MSILKSDWFRAALARAMAEDSFTALTPLEKSQVNYHVKKHGIPPPWFMRELKSKGLTFRPMEKPA